MVHFRSKEFLTWGYAAWRAGGGGSASPGDASLPVRPFVRWPVCRYCLDSGFGLPLSWAALIRCPSDGRTGVGPLRGVPTSAGFHGSSPSALWGAEARMLGRLFGCQVIGRAGRSVGRMLVAFSLLGW